MPGQSIFGFVPVSRRAGGLEIMLEFPGTNIPVSRRAGGLEIGDRPGSDVDPVSRRAGGLENPVERRNP